MPGRTPACIEAATPESNWSVDRDRSSRGHAVDSLAISTDGLTAPCGSDAGRRFRPRPRLRARSTSRRTPDGGARVLRWNSDRSGGSDGRWIEQLDRDAVLRDLGRRGPASRSRRRATARPTRCSGRTETADPRSRPSDCREGSRPCLFWRGRSSGTPDRRGGRRGRAGPTLVDQPRRRDASRDRRRRRSCSGPDIRTDSRAGARSRSTSPRTEGRGSCGGRPTEERPFRVHVDGTLVTTVKWGATRRLVGRGPRRRLRRPRA